MQIGVTNINRFISWGVVVVLAMTLVLFVWEIAFVSALK